LGGSYNFVLDVHRVKEVLLMNDEIRSKEGPEIAGQSCVNTITRKQFIETVVKRAALAGGLIGGYKVVDKFFVPPAYAQASGGCPGGLGSNCLTNPDTIVGTLFP
jgi:hypothetical protein